MDVVRFLLNSGANIELTDSRGRTGTVILVSYGLF